MTVLPVAEKLSLGADQAIIAQRLYSGHAVSLAQAQYGGRDHGQIILYVQDIEPATVKLDRQVPPGRARPDRAQAGPRRAHLLDLVIVILDQVHLMAGIPQEPGFIAGRDILAAQLLIAAMNHKDFQCTAPPEPPDFNWHALRVKGRLGLKAALTNRLALTKISQV